MAKFQLEHTSRQWMLFTLLPKDTVRTVSLPNGNKVTSVPLVQAVHTTQTQYHIRVLQLKTRYYEHQCNTCADLNVTAMVTVPPCEYTEFCCF